MFCFWQTGETRKSAAKEKFWFFRLIDDLLPTWDCQEQGELEGWVLEGGRAGRGGGEARTREPAWPSARVSV